MVVSIEETKITIFLFHLLRQNEEENRKRTWRQKTQSESLPGLRFAVV
jgi:hypothetical protein